jgi:SAM-dependent methyltransferase
MKIATRIKNTLHLQLSKVLRIARPVVYMGNNRHCPVCGKNSRKFGAYGLKSRQDAQCLYCNALERHRLVWIYFERMTDLFGANSLRMLHVAPEEVFEKLLRRKLGEGYLTADLHNPNAMVKMDITDIQYPNESFDVIYCSHVLEHVPDDRKAMSEFFRVLKPDGWAMLLVPIVGEATFEDLTITDPAERAKLFGQEDHVRIYGRDYKDRLIEAGFKVDVVSPADFMTQDEMLRMGINKAAGDIYLCRRIHSAS